MGKRMKPARMWAIIKDDEAAMAVLRTRSDARQVADHGDKFFSGRGLSRYRVIPVLVTQEKP